MMQPGRADGRRREAQHDVPPSTTPQRFLAPDAPLLLSLPWEFSGPFFAPTEARVVVSALAPNAQGALQRLCETGVLRSEGGEYVIAQDSAPVFAGLLWNELLTQRADLLAQQAKWRLDGNTGVSLPRDASGRQEVERAVFQTCPFRNARDLTWYDSGRIPAESGPFGRALFRAVVRGAAGACASDLQSLGARLRTADATMAWDGWRELHIVLANTGNRIDSIAQILGVQQYELASNLYRPLGASRSVVLTLSSGSYGSPPLLALLLEDPIRKELRIRSEADIPKAIEEICGWPWEQDADGVWRVGYSRALPCSNAWRQGGASPFSDPEQYKSADLACLLGLVQHGYFGPQNAPSHFFITHQGMPDPTLAQLLASRTMDGDGPRV